jgi:hypothetical protein
MYLAPIILFVYNRPEHTKKTIDALKLNQLAIESSLFIYSDGSKKESDIKSVAEVRDYVSTISGFKEINIILREKNLGLADSVISGVTEVIDKFGKAIVLEDDIVTSKYFLKFMNEALDFYKDKQNIYSISGYNFPIKIPKSYQHKIYISPRPSSWGWATWKDRWENAIWNPELSIDINNRKYIRKILDKAGKDLTPMLLNAVKNKIDSWAVKWAYTHLQNNAYCLYPTKSFVRNIGVDSTGTHFKTEVKKFDVEIFEDYSVNRFENKLLFSTEIQKQINQLVKPGLLRSFYNFIFH